MKNRKARSRRPPSPARRVLAGIVATFAVAAFLVVFLLLPAQCAGRRQAVDFDGVVEKKEIVASESRYGSRLRYVLIIREETGELVRFRVPRAMYERALVGMPARKKPGEPLPTLGEGAAPRGR
jgi:hypothetical protein